MPPLPTSSMSGSFQWPGPGVAARGRLLVDDRDDAQAAPSVLAVPAVLDVAGRAPQVADARAPSARLGVPHSHMLNTMGRPVASQRVAHHACRRLARVEPSVLHQSYLR